MNNTATPPTHGMRRLTCSQMGELPDYAVAYISELTSELESIITTCGEFMGMLDTVLEERDMTRDECGTLAEDLGEAHRRLAYYENPIPAVGQLA